MIRPATEEDLLILSRIEGGSDLTPWSREGFRRYFEPDGLFRILEKGGRVGAYAIFQVVDTQSELLRIAVRPALQGRGIGTRLMRACLEELRAKGVRDCFLEVREGNRSARRLYARCGFSVAGLRRDYYRNPPEDAVVMWRDLTRNGSATS